MIFKGGIAQFDFDHLNSSAWPTPQRTSNYFKKYMDSSKTAGNGPVRSRERSRSHFAQGAFFEDCLSDEEIHESVLPHYEHLYNHRLQNTGKQAA